MPRLGQAASACTRVPGDLDVPLLSICVKGSAVCALLFCLTYSFTLNQATPSGWSAGIGLGPDIAGAALLAIIPCCVLYILAKLAATELHPVQETIMIEFRSDGLDHFTKTAGVVSILIHELPVGMSGVIFSTACATGDPQITVCSEAPAYWSLTTQGNLHLLVLRVPEEARECLVRVDLVIGGKGRADASSTSPMSREGLTIKKERLQLLADL